MASINYKNKWALVTGASAGIGTQFARRLAREGANLILTARRKERLESLAQELQGAHGIRTEVIAADLSAPGAPEALFAAAGAMNNPVPILVNNAGFGVYGRLHETALEKNQRLIMLNIHALSTLTRLFLPAMVNAREGYIFHIASTAAFQPVAYMSNYAASKAFVLSFSEALWAEYRAQGVRVLAVCPGATETEFFDAMGTHDPALGVKDTAANVVKNAFAAMDGGKCCAISGPFLNRLLAFLTRFAPRALVASMGERVLRRKKSDA